MCLKVHVVFFRKLQSEAGVSARRRRLRPRPQQAQETAAVGAGGSGRHAELRLPDGYGVRTARGAGGAARPANHRITRGGRRRLRTLLSVTAGKETDALRIYLAVSLSRHQRTGVRI